MTETQSAIELLGAQEVAPGILALKPSDAPWMLFEVSDDKAGTLLNKRLMPVWWAPFAREITRIQLRGQTLYCYDSIAIVDNYPDEHPIITRITANLETGEEEVV